MTASPLTFGPFVLDLAYSSLRREESELRVGPRALALAQTLMRADGEVVGRDELIESCWPGSAVEESNLTVQIATLRKALGTQPDGSEWIATVPRVGYRMVRPKTGGRSDRKEPSIAVLPFANFSADARYHHLADGMSEDLITALSRFKTFAVIARNSSFVYKNRNVDIREVGQALGVRYVLEGSVRRSDGRVRVSAQLIETTDATHIWAEQFDGEIRNVFDFQDRITERVIGAIEPRIRKAEVERSKRKRPDNLDAYDLYLQALPLVQAIHVEGYAEAIDLLRRAIVLDPGYAPALALASWAHSKRQSSGESPPAGINDTTEAISLAERALAAGSDDAIVLGIAGSQLFALQGADHGYACLMRALELNPNSFIVVNLAGFGHWRRADYDQAIDCHFRALRLCPGAPEAAWAYSGVANAHLSAGRFEDALVWSLRSLEVNAALEWTLLIAAASYAHLGNGSGAAEMLLRANAAHPGISLRSLFATDAPSHGADLNMIAGLTMAGIA